LQVTTKPKYSDQNTYADNRFWDEFTDLMLSGAKIAEPAAGPDFPVDSLDSFAAATAEIRTVEHVFQS
jgi:hypothetical protein